MNDITPKEAIANLNHIYGMVAPDIQRSLDVAFKCMEERPQGDSGDLISREALKKAISELPNDNPSYYYTGDLLDRERVLDEIDNAPTVDLWQMRQEATENALKKAEVLYGRPQGEWEDGYRHGYRKAKEDVAKRIKEQYNEHHELIPYWLSIGDVKGGAE